MRLAILFSGQGNQQPEHVTQLRERASQALSARMSEIIPEVWNAASALTAGDLHPNHIAQPLIFAWQMNVWQALQPHLPRPVCVAGYSLGEVAACCAAGAFPAEAQGANRVVRLGVTTPSHTPMLAQAAHRFAQRLGAFPSVRLACPVLSAIDGRAERSGSDALDALDRQVCTPLDWDACLGVIQELQPDVVLEIGPGNALVRMWAERNDIVPACASEDFRTTAGLVRWLKERA